MPNIPEFNAPNLELRPSETGVEAFAAAGRRAGAFFNQAGESLSQAGREIAGGFKSAGDVYVNYQDHQQINAGADHASNLWATLQDSWNQTSAGADPHDPSVAKKWREEVLEPALSQFNEGFTTQRAQDWANHTVNTMRQHYFATTEADMSRLASVAVSNTVHNMANNFSSTLIKDPSALPAMLDQVDHSIDGVLGANPNIKGPDAAKVKLEVGEKMKESLVKAAIQGRIMNGAPWQDIANKYPQYTDAAELKMFERAAQVQSRANLAYTKQIEAYDRAQARDKVETERNTIWANSVSIDPQTNMPVIKPDFFKQVIQLPMKYPNAPNATETAKTMLDWGERVQKGEMTVSDPATFSTLSGNILSADKPTTVLDTIKAETADKITHKDGNQLRELIKLRDGISNDPPFKIAMDGAKQLIEGNTPGEKAMAVGKFPAFMQQFMTEYLKQRNAGTLPPNALDLNDENSLIRKMMAPFDINQNIGTFVKANGGIGAPPTKPAPAPPKPAPKQPVVPVGGYAIPGQT